MATKKKLLQAAAGNAGGAALNVEDVFSTYLYDGTGSDHYLAMDDVDVYNEGGLYWSKGRSAGTSLGNGRHFMVAKPSLGSSEIAFYDDATASNAGASTVAEGTWMQSDGTQYISGSGINTSGTTYASWTFRKAPKFFDVVTYTGDGVAGRTVSHNLGTTPGMIIVKKYAGSGLAQNWVVYHRGIDSTAPQDYGIYLNSTGARVDTAGFWNDTAPTSTEFTLKTDGMVNGNGVSYVAYLFAHNDGDGEFGPDGDADAIKCGSYTGTGATGNNVNLGFEPQWLMIKRTDSTGNWQIADVMRGMPNNGGAGAYQRLSANLSNAEVNGQEGPIPTSTGFVLNSTSTDTNGNGNTYIYIAIRRPTAVPESGTEVFDVALRSATSAYSVGFPTDLWIGKETTRTNGSFVSDRLRGGTKYLLTPTAGTEQTDAGGIAVFDLQDSFSQGAASQPLVNWNWKRAPKYMDVVAYTGNGTAGRTVAHNLGVAPEMMWVKNRDDTTDWEVYHSGLDSSTPQNYSIKINESDARSITRWQNTAPTSSVFTLSSAGSVNGNNEDIIAYLFATLAGISKVGSVTHSGTTNVDCGFTSGARFVLLKSTGTGDWYIWDSTRGIVSGNDPYLLLNTAAAEVTNTDYIDPLSSGFTITSSFTAGDYIFYAIA